MDWESEGLWAVQWAVQRDVKEVKYMFVRENRDAKLTKI